jgi:hypothetical protein
MSVSRRTLDAMTTIGETSGPTLSQEHYDLLQAVLDLQGADEQRHPSTADVGRHLLDLLKEHPPYFWTAQAPWQGTDPYARELEDAGLLEIHYGIAKYRRPDQPIEPVQHYYLGITDEGRRVLVEHQS